jgi:hypothetical protein
MLTNPLYRIYGFLLVFDDANKSNPLMLVLRPLAKRPSRDWVSDYLDNELRIQYAGFYIPHSAETGAPKQQRFNGVWTHVAHVYFANQEQVRSAIARTLIACPKLTPYVKPDTYG